MASLTLGPDSILSSKDEEQNCVQAFNEDQRGQGM